MSTDDTTLTTLVNTGDAAVIADLARTAQPTQVVTIHQRDGQLQLVVGHGPDGPKVVERQFVRKAFPDGRHGTVEVHTHEALIAYAQRHVDIEQSTLWVDVDRGALTVVLDDHGDNPDALPGWAAHRAVLQLRPSEEWRAWTDIDQKMVDQVALAEFLEDRLPDIAEPDGSTILDTVQTFHATVGARFKRAVSLHSGEEQLVYEEQVEASAGRQGEATVPRSLTLALRPFQGTEPVAVHANFRFAVKEGVLTMGVRLLNLAEVIEAALSGVADAVEADLGLTAIYGAAPASRWDNA